MTSTAKWQGSGYSGETSDGKCWWTWPRHVNGCAVHVIRFSPDQGEITTEHRKAARAAIREAQCS